MTDNELHPGEASVEQKPANEAQEESDRRYRLLFENLTSGFALLEMVYDENGNPADCRFLDVNPAFEKLTGLSAAAILGHTVLEVLPGTEQRRIRTYAEVVQTGTPIIFEDYLSFVGKWFETRVFRTAANQFAAIFADVSERKQAEKELRESEDRFRAVFDQAAVGVALLNTKTGQFVRSNQKYCDFLGYTMQEMLQKTYMDITFEQDVQENIDRNAQLMEGTRREFSLEKRFVRKDGRQVWGNLTISPLWKPGEKPQTYLHIAIVEDITERKQAEDALREATERYRTLTESIKDVVWVLDTETLRFLYVSPSVQQLRGYTPEEVMAVPADASLAPDSATQLRQWIEQQASAFNSGTGPRDGFYVSEVEQPCKDGSTVWTEAVTSYYRDARTGHVLVRGVSRDITERRKITADLEASHNALLEAQAIGHIGDWSLDAVTRSFVWSEEMYVIHGLKRGTPVSHDAYLNLIHHDDLHRVFEAMQSAMAGKRQEFVVDYRIVRPDGSLRFVSLTGKTLLDSSGEVTGMRGTTQDITDRKRAEQEKEAMQAQLVQSKKLEAVGQLAGGVAHNFNNLLTGILGFIDVARTDLDPSHPAVASLDVARTAALKAAGLARQLLSFGRSAMVVPTVQNANTAVESALELICSALPASIKVKRSLCPDAWDILVDSSQLTQVLLELVNNAREAMGNEGTLTIRTQNVNVDDSYIATTPLARTGEFVVISVADTGPGIDPAILPRLFEPFTTTRQFGRGMGLPTVFGTLNQAGGWATVHSELGTGARIDLYLPRHVQ